MVDLTTASGRMVARVMAAVDAQEAEQQGERIARATQQRRESGRLHGGGRTFGYAQDGTVIEAEAIRGGAELLLAGQGVASVLRLWRDRNLRTPTGREFYETQHAVQIYRADASRA